MVDHRILMHILYENVAERIISMSKTSEKQVSDSAFVFFPIARKEYQEKLNTLKASQYLERLRMLCPILGRMN